MRGAGTVTPAEADQAVVEVEQAIRQAISEQLAEGHTAVSLGMYDLDYCDRWTMRTDEEATATVRWEVDGTESVAVLPMADIGRTLLDNGATITEIGAPLPRPVDWHAVSRSAGVTIASRDQRGFGQLSGSIASHPSRRTLGARLLSYAERSGVPQVNERSGDVFREAYRQLGNEPPYFPAQTVMADIGVEETIRFCEEHSYFQPQWCVIANGALVGRSQPRPAAVPRLADRIVAARSSAIFGSSRVHLPSAQALNRRIDWDTAPETTQTAVDKIQLFGDYAKRASQDPADMVAALIDGTLPFSVAMAMDLGVSSVVEAWRRAGLSRREMQVRFCDQLGFKPQETCEVLRIADSSMRTHRERGRKKIRKTL